MDFEMRLDYQDSNLDKQNQNLLCYHYTIVQFLLKSGAKIEDCVEICKYSIAFFTVFGFLRILRCQQTFILRPGRTSLHRKQ